MRKAQRSRRKLTLDGKTLNYCHQEEKQCAKKSSPEQAQFEAESIGPRSRNHTRSESPKPLVLDAHILGNNQVQPGLLPGTLAATLKSRQLDKLCRRGGRGARNLSSQNLEHNFNSEHAKDSIRLTIGVVMDPLMDLLYSLESKSSTATGRLCGNHSPPHKLHRGNISEIRFGQPRRCPSTPKEPETSKCDG